VPLADAAPTIGLALAHHPENRSPSLKSFLTSFLTTIARDNVSSQDVLRRSTRVCTGAAV
jgi:hypothetical protein